MRDLLHDPNDLFWSAAEKTRYINRALIKRDRDTGQNRALLTFTTTIGVDTYTFTTLGITNVVDIIGVNLLYQNLRVVLGRTSFTEMNATVRQFQPLLQWAPLAVCRYSMNSPSLIVAPAPAIAYQIEIDYSKHVADDFLVNGTDPDPVAAPYTAPVKWYAAYLSKIAERAADEADYFKGIYEDEIAALEGNQMGMVPSMYRGGSWI